MHDASGPGPQHPYLLRALYEWCVDNGYTPYVNLRVDADCKVPPAFVKNGEITLNLGPGAVRDLVMDNQWLSFSARFGGVAQQVIAPVINVLAIYARETGEGMAFTGLPLSEHEGQDIALAPATPDGGTNAPGKSPGTSPDDGGEPPRPPAGRPTLRVVK